MYKQYTEANQKAWDAAALYHHKAKKQEWIEGFKQKDYTSFCEFEKEIYRRIDYTGKKVLQAPCNNGREVLSWMRMGAQKGLGIDISTENIKVAQEFNELTQLNAEFHQGDLFNLNEEPNPEYDIAMITIGSLPWMPNLREYFSVLKKFLTSEGELVFFEMHPMCFVFPYSFDDEKKVEFEFSYFHKEPLKHNESLDYYGQTEYESPTMFEFQHTIGDIMQGLLSEGFEILDFEEFPEDMGGGHHYLGQLKKVPLSYYLRAKRKH